MRGSGAIPTIAIINDISSPAAAGADFSLRTKVVVNFKM